MTKPLRRLWGFQEGIDFGRVRLLAVLAQTESNKLGRLQGKLAFSTEAVNPLAWSRQNTL